MFPDRDRRDAYIGYTRRIAALSHRWRSAQGPVPSVRAQRRNEALSWEGEVPDDPLSDAALTSNASLRFVDLGWTRATAAVGELGNRIGDAGAKALAAMLRSNRTLRSLDVSHNRISQAGLDAIAAALADNDTLVSLRHPQYGKAVNHDSVDALHARLESNWERFAASEAGHGVTRDDLATPRSTQEILSVYRTA